jgi:hypothetical protein
VPFGLAIRGALNKDKSHDSYADDDDDELAAYSRHEEDQLAEMRAQEERERESSRKRQDVASRLLGDKPASLGELLSGVELGAPATGFQPESVREALEKVSDVVAVDWDVDAARLNAVTVRLRGGDYDCGLKDVLDRWGGNGELWANQSLHQRAEFDHIACSVRFEKYVDVDQWLDKGAESIVPFADVGKPEAKLHQRVMNQMDDGSEGDDSFGWHDVGLAGAMGKTTLVAYTKGGKIAAITATFRGDAQTYDALTEKITKLVGTKPTRTVDSNGDYDDGAPTIKWKSHPPVELHDGDVRVLTIGTIPEPPQ